MFKDSQEKGFSRPDRFRVRCNNCDRLFVDENEQEGYPGEFLENMVDEGGPFYGCPTCETDEYLMDLF